MSGGSRSFEDMLAYVDENGVPSHDSPQDVKPEDGDRRSPQIEISVPRDRSEIGAEEPMSGTGGVFHRIQRLRLHQGRRRFGEKYFFHITNAPAGIAEGDRVTFELERGTRGMNAVRIVISNK